MARCCVQPEEKRSPKHKNRKKRARTAPPPPDSRHISEISVGDQLIGTVRDVGPANSSWLSVGVVTSTGKEVRARLRHSRYRNNATAETEESGTVLPVYVHKVNRPAARIEVRKGTPRESSYGAVPKDGKMLEDLVAGQELCGRVVAVGPYGAVLDVNAFRRGKHGRVIRRTGLLSRRRFQEGWASEADPLLRDDAQRIVRVGDELEVWVRVALAQNGFLELDSAPVDLSRIKEEREEKRSRRRRILRHASPETLEIGEKRFGTVRETAKFGLFVDIGIRTDGLIHYTNMGEKHRHDWKEVIGVGSRVVTEVTSVSGNRVGLKLLFLGDEEEQENFEAMSYASSAFARVGDVVKAKNLNVFSRAERGLSGDVHQVQKVRGQTAVKDTAEIPADTVYDAGEKDEGKQLEKFSDEYFEDKYGF